MKVYLDGTLIEVSEISPDKHTFIGTFRSPTPPYAQNIGMILCFCGSTLQTVQSTQQHWRDGHFDIPQYRSISLNKDDK